MALSLCPQVPLVHQAVVPQDQWLLLILWSCLQLLAFLCIKSSVADTVKFQKLAISPGFGLCRYSWDWHSYDHEIKRGHKNGMSWARNKSTVAGGGWTRNGGGNLASDEGQIMMGLRRYRREFGFYSKSNGKSLQGFKQRTDMVWFRFWRASLVLCGFFVLKCGPFMAHPWTSIISELVRKAESQTVGENISQHSHHGKQYGNSSDN